MDFRLTPEQEGIQQLCRRLAADFATRAAQHDRDTSLPLENYEILKREGLYGLLVPKELGGWGAGFLGWTLAAEELAQGCPTTALTFNMHIAAVEVCMDDPLVSPAARERMAALVVQDKKLIATALSEPGTSGILPARSFVPSVQARRVSGGYLLRGRKSFLSMVEGCQYAAVLAHPEEDPNPLASIILLMPCPAPGQRVEEVWDTLGMRGTRSNDLVLENCFVPEEGLCLRTDNYVIWSQTTPTWGNGFSYTPVYLGVAIAAYHQACETVQQRVPRGYAQPLSYHPDVRRRVAEMNVDLEAARLLMYHAAWLADMQAGTPATAAALLRAKYFVGEAVARITRSVLTLCGAHALFKTSPLERLFRDGASGPVMPPSSDACLFGVGRIALGLKPTEILPPLKVAG
ncbi:MAG: acyl-CoA/acyl-ACP dehydrogenase [Nitrospinae bacterium]|nr:acyl-CoA/acyl-ACP dehydrogenase [Nitrospinota bacterium]